MNKTQNTGDISTLLQSRCQTKLFGPILVTQILGLQEDDIRGVCFVLELIKRYKNSPPHKLTF